MRRLRQELSAAAAVGDVEREVALRNALDAGERLRAAAHEAERQIATTRAAAEAQSRDEFRRDDMWVAREAIRLITESRAIAARGPDIFFDPNNPVEFGAARMTVIDLNTVCEGFSEEFTNVHGDLPLKAIARTRSKLAHHYEDINRDLVWNMIDKELPALARTLQQIIARGE